MLKIGAFIALIILNALIVHEVLISHKIIKKNSYFTVIIFILLSLPILKIENYWPIIIANFSLVLILNELLNLAESNTPKQHIFNASFLVGTICVIQIYLGIYYFLISFFLGYYKHNTIKNFIIQNIGFVAPFIIFYSISSFILPDYNFSNNNGPILNNSPIKYIASYATMLCIITLACGELIYNFNKKKIKSKQLFLITGVIVILSFYPILIGHLNQFIYLTIMPITIVITNYLIYTKYIRFGTFLVRLWIVLFLFEFFYI